MTHFTNGYGGNTPKSSRTLVKVVNGDTLTFAIHIRLPYSPVPVSKDDERKPDVSVVLSENRFYHLIWSGTLADGDIVLDEHIPGVAYVTVPRDVMSALRRGIYAFSVTVDDGKARETQTRGHIQVEYEPTSATHDIPYREDSWRGDVGVSFRPARVLTEYASVDAFPETGVKGVLYLAADDNTLYRWDGSQYTRLAGSGSPTESDPVFSAWRDGELPGIVARVDAHLSDRDDPHRVRDLLSGAARPLPPYLHELSFSDAYPADAAWYYAQHRGHAGCSVRRVGGRIERNYDWTFDDMAEFVVHMAAGPGRFASVGVANVGPNLTEDFVASGKWSRFYKALPGHTVDGVNERGVFACANVVDGVWPRTSGDIHGLGAVRWVLDNAASAAAAAEGLAAGVYFPDGFGMNLHYLVADADETWLVENGTAQRVDSDYVLTNYAMLEDTGSGSGRERHDMLVNGARIEDVWYTRAYSPDVSWLSDFGGDADLMAAARGLWAAAPRASHRGESLGGESWWQTVHTSVYDLDARALSICVQETPDWHAFQVSPLSPGQLSVLSGGPYAEKADTYGKQEVDDKITRFVAHYLTDRRLVDGHYRYVPFETHDALADAKAHHTAANPRFFYAGEGFTPTKNDYCVVLDDESVEGGGTTRYAFVGVWGEGGSWQYQYTINETALSEQQWAALDSGVTAGWIEEVEQGLSDLETGKQDKIGAYVSGASVVDGVLKLTKSDGGSVSFSGGVGSYDDLDGRPSVNGQTLTGDVSLATPEQVTEVSEKVDAISESVSVNNRFLLDGTSTENTTAAIQTHDAETDKWTDEIRFDKGYDPKELTDDATETVALDKSVQTVRTHAATLAIKFPESVSGTVRDFVVYVFNQNGSDGAATAITQSDSATSVFQDENDPVKWTTACPAGGEIAIWLTEIPGMGWRAARSVLKRAEDIA